MARKQDFLWAIPICSPMNNVKISDFSLKKQNKKIDFISFKQDYSFKFYDFDNDIENHLKLFSQEITYQGQIPLVAYSNNLNELLKIEDNLEFEYDILIAAKSNLSLKQFSFPYQDIKDNSYKRLSYSFSLFSSYDLEYFELTAFFKADKIEIEADTNNTLFIKNFLSHNFSLPLSAIEIQSLNKYFLNSADFFPLYFCAILQALLISQKTGKKVIIRYYKKHFKILEDFKIEINIFNILNFYNKIEEIYFDIYFNRPLNFLYGVFLKKINEILLRFYPKNKLSFSLHSIKDETIFAFDNFFFLESSLINSCFANVYGIAIDNKLFPLSYLCKQVKESYQLFLIMLKKSDLKHSITKKASSVFSLNEFSPINMTRRGVGVCFIGDEELERERSNFVKLKMYKDKIDIFIPYYIRDFNLINYLKNIFSKSFDVSYLDINFIVREEINYGLKYELNKNPYLIERAVLAILERAQEYLELDLTLPLILTERLDSPYYSRVFCFVELEFLYLSNSIVIKDLNFYLKDGKLAKLKVNNARVSTIIKLAIEHITRDNVNIIYERELFNIEFLEDGEFYFSYNELFTAVLTSFNLALMQIFNTREAKIPFDFKNALINWGKD